MPNTIIDADTHITEPADLWTSRVSSKWGEAVPHVLWDEEATLDSWYVNDVKLGPATGGAAYGWPEHWPYTLALRVQAGREIGYPIGLDSRGW